MNYCLKIKDLLSQQAILEDEDNNLIYLPLKKLPNNLNIGQSINLQINLENNQKISPKEIINELLGAKNN